MLWIIDGLWDLGAQVYCAMKVAAEVERMVQKVYTMLAFNFTKYWLDLT